MARNSLKYLLIVAVSTGAVIASIFWLSFRLETEGLNEDSRDSEMGITQTAISLEQNLLALGKLIHSDAATDPAVWEPRLLSILAEMRATLKKLQADPAISPQVDSTVVETLLELDRETRHRLILQGPSSSVLDFVGSRLMPSLLALEPIARNNVMSVDEASQEQDWLAESGWQRTLALCIALSGLTVLVVVTVMSQSAMRRVLSRTDQQVQGAEEELSRSQNRLQSVLENAPVGIFLKDREGRFERVNAHFEKMYGTEPGQLIGLLPEQYSQDDLSDITREQDLKVLREGLTIVEDHQAEVDGDTRDFYLIKFPIFDATGEVDGVAGVVTDVTELHEARRALRRTQQRLDLFLKYSPAVTIIKDREGRYESVNESFVKLVGREESDVIGKLPHDLWSKSTADQVRRFDREVMRTGDVVKGIYSAENSSQKFYIQTVKFPIFDEDGQIDGLGAIELDVTEATESSLNLKATNRRLHALLDNAPFQILLKDCEGRYERVNKEFERLFGATNDDVVGLIPSEFMDSDAARNSRAKDLIVLDEGRALEEEIHVDLPSGLRDFYTVRFPIFDEKGDIDGLGLVVTDLTEVNATRNALAKTENRLKALLDYSPALAILKDKDGRYESVNAAFEKFLGIKKSEVSGRLPEDVWPPEIAKIMLEHDRLVLETGEVIEDLYVVKTDQKEGYFQSVKFPLFDEHGEIDGVGAIEIDVSEATQAREALEESRRRMEAILSNVPIAIFLKGLDGKFILANEQFLEFFDVSEEDLIGQGVSSVFPELAESTLLTDEKVIRTGENITWQFKFGPDERSFRVIKFPLRNSIGEIVGVGGIAVDVTDELKSAEALITAKEAAEEATRAKSDFLANMSHEIRTPLNAILGFSEMLRSEFFGPLGDEKYNGYVDDIHRSGVHLMGLLGDILDLSKVEAGLYDFDEQIVDLSELAGECIQIAHGNTTKQKLRFSAECDPSIRLWGDARALRQIVLNLLSNAIKFTPDGGQILVIWQRTVDGGGCLAIRDTGVGISKENIDRVLMPFTQVGEPMLSSQPGTGIGLSITRELAKLHDAELEVESKIDAGTTVHVHFPKHRLRAANKDA